MRKLSHIVTIPLDTSFDSGSGFAGYQSSTFDQDMRTSFKKGIADAADVAPDLVTILSIEDVEARRSSGIQVPLFFFMYDNHKTKRSPLLVFS